MRLLSKALLRSSPWLLLAVVALAPAAQAKDYGVLGNTWPIIEVDVRKLLVESAARANWGKVKQELQESAKSYGDNLPKRYLTPASSNSVVWHDPSIVLTSDIKSPVRNPDGSITWGILYKKGTRVNPLDYNRPVQPLFYFDGVDPDQVELVRKLLADSIRFIPVEAGAGNPQALAKLYGQPVFYADSMMMTKFSVEHLPAALFPGTGQNRDNLGVFYFAKPFSDRYVMKTLGIPYDSALEEPAKK